MPEFYPHQPTGAVWLAARKRAFFFDDAGLGKTITAIAGAERIGARKILVVVPTVVLWNWRREFAKWALHHQVQLLATGKDKVDDGCSVTITTHGLLLKPALFSQLTERRWDLGLLDECQFFRGPTAQRTHRFYGAPGHEDEASIVNSCDRTWVMTGTPMPNDASNLWSHLHGLFPERIPGALGRPMSFIAFRKRYCVLRQTDYGIKVVGNKRLPELKKKLEGIVLRRRKKDVLKDLPPIRYEIVTLRPDTMPSELKALDARLRPHILKKVAEAMKETDGETPGDFWRALRGEEDFSRLRRMVGLAKVEPVAELLSNELDCLALNKVVVFGHHTDTIRLFREKMRAYNPIEITGATGAKKRQQLVDRFQQDGSTRVAICQLVAGGVGITLTAASDVVLLEASYVPGENAQAADRTHRIGQARDVRVRFVALAETSDEELVDALRLKTRMIREVLD